MINLKKSLTFPTLVYQGEINFKGQIKSKYIDDHITPLYRLEWDHRYTGLPEIYDDWITNKEFAINNNYLLEIRKHCHLAICGLDSIKVGDYNNYSLCLEPMLAHCYVAFKLLSDCAYDCKTRYFYRGADKVIMPYAMLYKFWSYQINNYFGKSKMYTLKYVSMFDKLDRDIAYANDAIKEEAKIFSINFLRAIDPSIKVESDISVQSADIIKSDLLNTLEEKSLEEAYNSQVNSNTDNPMEVKVLINGLPVIGVMIPINATEKEAIDIAMQNLKIMLHTKGKVMVSSFYEPGYCLNMTFLKPDKSKKYSGLGKEKS